MRGRLAFDSCVECKQHFFDAASVCPFNQLGDVQFVGTYAIEWRQMPAKHMIAAGHNGRAFECPQIADLFNDNNERGIAPRVLANAARADRIKISAIGAFGNFIDRLLQGFIERNE